VDIPEPYEEWVSLGQPLERVLHRHERLRRAVVVLTPAFDRFEHLIPLRRQIVEVLRAAVVVAAGAKIEWCIDHPGGRDASIDE
jgi:hypothetical protein